MLLSEVLPISDVTLVRNGGFAAVGFLSDVQPDLLTFLESERLLQSLRRNRNVTCVITTPELAERLATVPGVAICASPRSAFHAIHEYLTSQTNFYWKDFASEIDPSAVIHPRAVVALKNVRIGPGSVIEANAVIQERCRIGSHVVVRSGAVVGSVGFQTTRPGAQFQEMTHAGGTELEDRAHVLANAVIASAVFGQVTRIGRESRIGAAAFVSHNVQVGARTFIGHGAVVNGNVILGDEVWVGPGAVIANGIRVGHGACITMGAVVISEVAARRHVSGNFAVPHRLLLRKTAGMQ
jgi:UDP-3-O-[3-hydroxymyristoyl] glucosamine N-acyltransferase